MKIGILIPSTYHDRVWKTIQESYLFYSTLKTFLLTYDKEHEYVFYIGIDKNDRIYDDEDNKKYMKRFCGVMKNIQIRFIYMCDAKPGHLTVMWNILFKHAYDDNCDYFFQCGDDVSFRILLRLESATPYSYYANRTSFTLINLLQLQVTFLRSACDHTVSKMQA